MSGARRGELHLMRHLLVTCVVAACMCGAAAALGRGDVIPTILIAAPLVGIAGEENALPMALLMLTGCLAAYASYARCIAPAHRNIF